jgi:phosphatidylglycerol:prolipoprotein diacylglycerol transferase
MHPILFKLNLPFIGEFPIRSFGVMVMIGVLVAAWWLGGALRRLGVEKRDVVSDLVTVCVITGFLGARLLYVVIHPEALTGADGRTNIFNVFAIWQGGIVSYGGFFGGALGGWWYARRHRLPVLRLGDAVLPALALGQVFGRVGCLLVGDDYGRVWESGPDWATVSFPAGIEGSLIPPHLLGVKLVPIQILLSLMNLVVFLIAVGWLRRRRFDGQVLAITMILYALGRFSLEFLRGDDEARGMAGGLSTAQWWSIGTAALGLWLYLRWRATASRDGSPTTRPEAATP